METLMGLKDWADKHDVMDVDLLELAAEGLLPVGKSSGQLFINPVQAERVWAEHGPRMLAKHPSTSASDS